MITDLFLVDGEKEYSYCDLISKINSQDFFYPNFKDGNLFEFWCNLLIAIYCDQHITLIDSDLSESELKYSNINKLDQKIRITKEPIKDIYQLTHIFLNSKAEISIFTSGTTGQPKEVKHSIKNLLRGIKIGEKFNGKIWGFAYNPTHMAGIQVFFQAINNKNPLINIFNKNRKFIFDKISTYKITHLSATPTFYRLLLPFEQTFKEVERVTFGGEKSSETLYNSIVSIFPNARITNVYASTEAGTLFATHGDNFQIPEDYRAKIEVIDDELYIHKSLLGYSTTYSLKGDFYPSGDLIEWVDKKNSIFKFKSRKNELINIGGYKVNPQEVEEIIRSFTGVIDVLVYGKANSVLGNILCADVVRELSSDLNEKYIRKKLSGLLQDFKIPRRIKFVETLNMTRSGKMKRI